MIKKIKDFIHKHKNLEKMIFSFWAVFWILRARIIFKRIKKNNQKINFKVVILAVRSIPTTNFVYFDAVFGHAFEKLGASVKMLYCDGLLDSCDADIVFRGQDPQCFICQKFGPLVKKSLNLDCASYNQYISFSEMEEIKKISENIDISEASSLRYLGVDVGKQARASAIRYFLFGKLNLEDENEIRVFRKKLFYAMVMTKIAENFRTMEKPDAVFMLHGIYSSWGPFYEYFRTKGIDTIIYGGMTPRIGYFMFNRNDETNAIVSKKEWSRLRDIPLDKDQQREIRDYLDKRIKGKTGDQMMYRSNFDNGNKKDLDFKGYKRRYVMYPNLAWDAAIKGQISDIFEDVFEWLDNTIDFFKNKKDYQLIIKPHPAELVFEGSSRSIAEYIKEKHKDLPENIIVLSADAPYSAYDFFDNKTISLTFNGSVGFESAALGYPALVVAQAHYKDADVVYDIKTKDEYFNLIDNPQKIISFAENNIEIAEKYAYFYFIKSVVRVPFYDDKKWAKICWNKIFNHKELFSDKSDLMKICRRIINREDIFNPL
ncbi:MAG: hypothetical protein PHI53_01440 [Candidatus Pacebacteria bacterium]|nr:hypothetical protein [Candidatus Paceibacterota bacterium]